MSEEFEESIRLARGHLLHARTTVSAEISGYPTPISGCDAQFNYLLAERQKILEALRVLDDTVFVPTPRTPYKLSGIESR